MYPFNYSPVASFLHFRANTAARAQFSLFEAVEKAIIMNDDYTISERWVCCIKRVQGENAHNKSFELNAPLEPFTLGVKM